MKRELLDYLIDPFGEMAKLYLIDVEEEDGNGIKEGTLRSKKGEFYPIINYIPRILDDGLLISLTHVDKGWLSKYRPHLNFETRKKDQQVEVAKSFAAEWKKFNKVSSTYNETRKSYFQLWNKKLNLHNKMVLDAGCGMGRWAMFTADKSGKLFCVDISQSVDEAQELLKDKENVFFVQADLMKLPFKEDFFEAIYCLGVLHHLPDTKGAFIELAKRLKRQGDLLTYLYYAFDNRPILFKYVFKLANILRAAISKLPKRAAHFISLVLAVLVYLPLISIGRIVKRMGFEVAAKNIPLYEGYFNKDFYTIYNDSVDRFTTPLEKRFSRNDILSMYKENGFSEAEVQSEVPYWVVNGVKG